MRSRYPDAVILALLATAALAQDPVPVPIAGTDHDTRFGDTQLGSSLPSDRVHAGIPIADVQALHPREGKPPRDPAFGTAETGWSIIVPGGIVFVYVARSDADLDAWTALQLSRQRQPPLPVEHPVAGVDAAWRRGTDFAMLRDGNIGIMVQGTDEAGEEAAVVRSLIVDVGPPWPAPPSLVAQPDGTWLVDAPDALQVDWQGGRRVPGGGLRVTEPPARLVAWDALGRAVTWWRDGPPTATSSAGEPPR